MDAMTTIRELVAPPAELHQQVLPWGVDSTPFTAPDGLYSATLLHRDTARGYADCAYPADGDELTRLRRAMTLPKGIGAVVRDAEQHEYYVRVHPEIWRTSARFTQYSNDDVAQVLAWGGSILSEGVTL